MLGHDLVAVLSRQPDAVVTALPHALLDVSDAAAVSDAVAGHDVVVNAAAWTDVDRAEDCEEEATAVNGHGTRNVALACREHGARLLHISTDYVFSGHGTEPYDEDAPADPVNAYGRSKAVGEAAIAELLPDAGYVVRTAWLYGARGSNFVATMTDLAARQEFVDVVDDQWGQPTWSYALAERLALLGYSALAGTAPAGRYHGTASGAATWYDLARAVFELSGLDADRVRPVSSAAYARKARRPAYSILGHRRWEAADLKPLEDWRTMLAEALREIGPAHTRR
ncbi:dTDP-4-dehydrorhamnose reductase [Embleya hyalina]|uniref:dTDP-4-dehydrorhamnose reductase n=2 Tax=Embleya hyalina TaxID=516124 RepID=A0A401YI64_9ACTN|nr:dTDP-4-dehydrorhamnose reductase [Embleya hyalina]